MKNTKVDDMRKFIIFVALALVIFAGIFWWRLRHPHLSDEQQIAYALDGIRSAASDRSPRGVANYLARDFKVGEIRKSEFQNSLAGGMLQYRVIDLKIPNPQIKVTGETAISTGDYVLSLKPEYNSPAEISRGHFQLQWKKQDGQWLIVSSNSDLPNIPAVGG